MEKPEILAPAGGTDSLYAALYTGADAVYLGAGDFNARRSAHNFDEESLVEAVGAARRWGAKVYLTVNTLVFDDELPALEQTLRMGCSAGVDEMIVADLGVYSLLRRRASGMKVSASTQMSIHNSAGVELLQELGYDRVVLARELSREELKKICREAQIEVEAFVHGALCMCVSGQCTLSSIIGGRSGNRGMCAQPCRLDFTAPGGAGYALSLKDLSLVNQVGELGDMGVKSLKIEGRMKRPEYVAASVRALRQVLDEGEADPESLHALESVFSRSGFTSGYYDGKLGPQMFGTRQKEDVTATQKVLGEIEKTYVRPTPRVPLRMEAECFQGRESSLTVTDPQENRVRVEGPAPERAQNRPTDEALCRRALTKTGGTPYFLQELILHTDGESVLPVSSLNALRRSALEELDRVRSRVEPVPFSMEKIEISPHVPAVPLQFRARFDRFDQVPLDEIETLEGIILPPGELLAHWEDFPMGFRDRLWAELPRAVFFREEEISCQLRQLEALGCQKALCGNLGAIRFSQRAGIVPLGDFGLNLANTPALEQMERLGLEDVTLSFELTLDRIRRLGGRIPRGILCYGRLPLMLTRNCAVKHSLGCKECGRRFLPLTDRTGRKFPAACEEGKEAMVLYNAHPLWLADRLEEIRGVEFATFYFTSESREEAAQVFSGYRQGASREGITRGLYYRKVL